MTIYYLYVKTHNITGMKYLGFTTLADPYSYFGSGVHWNNHLRIHGKSITTEIIKECVSHDELKHWGKHYSALWDVVRSKEWANEVDETGNGIINPTEKIINKRRETRKRNKESGLVPGWTDDSTKKCIDTKKANGTMNTRTQENIAKQLATRIERGTDPNSDEVKQKCRDTKKERGIISNFIESNPSKITLLCEHCNRYITGKGAFSRFHDDNCKSRVK